MRGACAAIAILIVAAPAVAGPSAFAVTADIGVPDGGVASVEYRPIPVVAVSLGISHNLVSTGVRAGVGYAPLHRRRWSPLAQLAYGHFPDGDANSLVGDPDQPSPLLERVGYDFVDLDVGIEAGSRRVRFYVLLGVSRVTGTIHGIDALDPDDTTTISVATDPAVAAWIASVKLGVAVTM